MTQITGTNVAYVFFFLMDKPSYILVATESDYWPEYMSIPERLSLECGDVVNLNLKGAVEKCLVISKGTQEACEKVMKVQRAKRSKISEEERLSKKVKLAENMEKICGCGKDVGSEVVSIMEQVVAEIRESRRDARNLRLYLESMEKPQTSADSGSNDLQPILWKGENMLEVHGRTASCFARRIAEKVFTVTELTNGMIEPGKKRGCREPLCEKRSKLIKDCVIAKFGIDEWAKAKEGINNLGRELKLISSKQTNASNDENEDPQNESDQSVHD